MKPFSLPIFLSLGAAWAQTAPAPSTPAPPMPNLPEETVVATFEDGAKFTMGDFKRIYSVLPPANQEMAIRDRNEFLHQWAVLRRLSKMADDLKLGEQSPYKEAIEHSRMQVLVQAKINEAINSATVEPAEIVKYYDSNKQKYQQVKVKAIYIAFSENPAPPAAGKGKKVLTDAEAKAKAAKLLAAIRGGADFVKLVKENSDDAMSREKDGDFATLRMSDNIPDAFRTAVFALKQGEVSEPLRQPKGYYLLRAEEVTFSPLSQVRDTIFNDLKQQQYAEWFAKLNRDTKVTVNPAFVAPPEPGKK
jgi:peptidyl-prolyl cis-trans isomerase C